MIKCHGCWSCGGQDHIIWVKRTRGEDEVCLCVCGGGGLIWKGYVTVCVKRGGGGERKRIDLEWL